MPSRSFLALRTARSQLGNRITAANPVAARMRDVYLVAVPPITGLQSVARK